MLKKSALLFGVSAALCSTLSGVPSFADIAPEPMSGGITIEVPPGEVKTTIAMQKEVVKLDVYPNRCVTTARFFMTNLGTPVSMEVGFPSQNLIGDDFTKFEAWVNGKGVAVKRKTLSKTMTEGTPGKIINTNWVVWNMNFPFGETQYVDVTYENVPQVHDMLTYENGGGISGGHYEQMIKELDQRHVDYVLYTGAYWRGPIGKCDITVEFHPPLSAVNVISTYPTATSKDHSKISWHLKNLYEGDTQQKNMVMPGSFAGLGVRVEYSTTKSLKEVTKIALDEFSKHPDDGVFAKIAADCLSKLGRKKEELDLITKFLSSQANKIAKEKYLGSEYSMVPQFLTDTFRLSDALKTPQKINAIKPALRTVIKRYIKKEIDNKYARDAKEREKRILMYQALLKRCS